MDKKLIKERLKEHTTQINVVLVLMGMSAWRKVGFKIVMEEGIDLKACETEWVQSSYDEQYEWVSNNFIPAFKSNEELQEELFKHITSMAIKVNRSYKLAMDMALGGD